MLKTRKEYVYMSKLLLKFINTLIFFNFKTKIQNLLYFSLFY